MKLLIDTESKTIEVFDDTPILEVSKHFQCRMYNGYTITRASTSMVVEVSEVKYTSNTTEDAEVDATI